MKLEEIDKKEPSHSGHVVYPAAIHLPDGKKIVYKENKNQIKELTQFEMAFAALARLLIDSNMTPKQHFVVDQNDEVQGLACEHLCYMIAHHEETDRSPKEFYKLDGKVIVKTKSISTSKDIPYYFLNQLEPGFFSKLRALHKDKLTIDMTSLASLLTTSYILEEDDLHKGNFGFYFVEKEGRPQAVFFKIDHDMMFANALMSYGHGRVNHWGRKDSAFDITARDLMSFPFLHDSSNHYWPTSFSILSKPYDNKVYRNNSDIEAFKTLADDEDFKKAKWRSFLKHISIPPELVRETLNQTLDENKADERAKINMIVQAFAARQSRLRSELFTLKPFIEFVNEFKDIQEMKNEITVDIRDDVQKRAHQKRIQETLEKYKRIYQPGQAHDDTPLHVAIRLGDFRYYDQWHSVYSRYLNVVNSDGHTPLDLALSMVEEGSHSQDPRSDARYMVEEGSHSKDPRSDARYIVQYLLHRGAESAIKNSKEFKKTYDDYIGYVFDPSKYKDRAEKITSFDDLKNLMKSIDEDFRFSLKMKKKLSLFCLKYYVYRNQDKPEEMAVILKAFKRGLDGDRRKNYAPLPELQFIRQLRSRFWIIRQFRGLIGGTTTQIAMNEVIDKALKRLEPKSPGCLSFFNCFKSHSRPGKQAEIHLPISATTQ